MKKKYSWTFWRHLVFAIAITSVSLISELVAQSIIGAHGLRNILSIIKPSLSKDAASIGIIGGSDGPTAIYLSGTLMPWLMLYPHAVLFVILILLYFPLRIYVNSITKSNGNTSER